jgi:hypothetical protein
MVCCFVRIVEKKLTLSMRWSAHQSWLLIPKPAVWRTRSRGEPAVVIILAATVSIFATNGSSPLLAGFLTPAIYIMAIVFWLLRYRRFTAGDEQFRRSRKDLIKSLNLWSALLFVQILLLGYFVKFRS